MADVDIILAARAALLALGLKGVTFSLSHRGILSGWLASRKLENKITPVLRAIDKLRKFGEKTVADELKASGLKQEEIKDIIKFVNLKGSPRDVIKAMRLLDIKDDRFIKALDELEKISELFKASGVKSNEYVFDLRISRGLDYYTGMVFETYLASDTKIGSICSGGRYDNLLGQYRRDPIPGVGASIGLSLSLIHI